MSEKPASLAKLGTIMQISYVPEDYDAALDYWTSKMGAGPFFHTEKVEVEDGAVAISTMHFAKGLEFRSVVVMACDDDVIPQSDRIEMVADDADLEEVYNTERHLLYVACTRARDHLLVTGIAPVSEFVDDFLRTR